MSETPEIEVTAENKKARFSNAKDNVFKQIKIPENPVVMRIFGG